MKFINMSVSSFESLCSSNNIYMDKIEYLYKMLEFRKEKPKESAS